MPERPSTAGWLRAITEVMQRNTDELAQRDDEKPRLVQNDPRGRVVRPDLRSLAENARQEDRHRPLPPSRRKGLHDVTIIGIISIISLAMVAVPSTIAFINMRRLHRAPKQEVAPRGEELVSCCIPARNEEDNLEACIQILLSGDHEAIEILVYDEESTDGTEILARLMKDDPHPIRFDTTASGRTQRQATCLPADGGSRSRRVGPLHGRRRAFRTGLVAQNSGDRPRPPRAGSDVRVST